MPLADDNDDTVNTTTLLEGIKYNTLYHYYDVLVDGCMLLLLAIMLVIMCAVSCYTGRKTVTVEDLLQPDAPFVQRQVTVGN